ncbi:methyltransferase domain-containing protein [Ornithinimicrobium tianjinense]|uniref:Methyltransferase domain-containing protein n=1 Tax=Ornithinimicrobium tianjinense TaxID=1195761 RepID=A0A917BGL5_9MICO|nr:methyltransferase domain-containing protein [Ornithinimicrobium tianjinense]GGF44193.1 hypothetical protein GCM10011366_09850 [Ornithinimicrobium tianjinense]
MSGCCDPLGCDAVFGRRYARATARTYLRRGLDPAAQRMVDWVVGRGIEGASVLEIGGGIGGPHVELLRRGAAHATNVELVPAYEEEAARVLSEAGLVARVDRRIGDLAVDPDVAGTADVVVMNRVVCCYPDPVALVGAAADHATRIVALTHPPRNVLTRALLAVQRGVGRLFGMRYQAFAHPPELILDTLRRHGFTAQHLPSRGLWQIVVATRV